VRAASRSPFAPNAPAKWETVRIDRMFKARRDLPREDDQLVSAFIDGQVTARSNRPGSIIKNSGMEHGYKRIRKGDLAISGMNAHLGGLGISDSDGKCSPVYLVLRPVVPIDSGFCSYLLRHMAMSGYIRSLVQTIRFNSSDFKFEDLKNLYLPMPSVSEQKAIADYLDRETTRIDALITKKQHMIELLEERFEASVFGHVTYGIDSTVAMREVRQKWVGQIPEHWGMPTVSMNFDLQLGKMLNSESAEGPDQYSYLRNTNVQWDRFDFDDLASMHFSSKDRERCELRVGDVLVCEGGEVGRSAVWTGDLINCFFQKAIHRLRPRSNANGRFLMYCLRAAAKQSVFSVEGNTSTIVHLTSEQLAVHRFPWPPFNEQAAIVEVLDAQAQRLKNAQSMLRRQIRTLIERRQALITAMVTGELKIPEVAA
jgi:type I restriction enzyme S subunit